MKTNFATLLCLSALLAGCARNIVPVTKLDAGPMKWENPKDMTASGIKVTQNTNGTFEATIDSVTSKMNPEVIQMSSEGLSKIIQTAVDAGASAVGKAAGTAAK